MGENLIRDEYAGKKAVVQAEGALSDGKSCIILGFDKDVQKYKVEFNPSWCGWLHLEELAIEGGSRVEKAPEDMSDSDILDWAQEHLTGLCETLAKDRPWKMSWTDGEGGGQATRGDSLRDCVRRAIAQ